MNALLLQLVHETVILEESFNKWFEFSRSCRDQVQTAEVRREVAEEVLRAMEEKLEAQVNGTKQVEKELVAEKQKVAAMEVNLRKKKKKISLNKASIIELKKLGTVELSLKSAIA